LPFAEVETVTEAVSDAVESAMLRAITVAEVWLGQSGAEYTPVLEIVPKLELPPATPFTIHATVVFEVPDTFATKRCEVPAITTAEEGVTVTATEDEPVMVTLAVADLLVSAALVAEIETLPPDGTLEGAW
jgi:hypothetical protein